MKEGKREKQCKWKRRAVRDTSIFSVLQLKQVQEIKCRAKWYQSIKTDKLEHIWSFEFQTVQRLEARSEVFRFKVRAHTISET